MPLSKGERLGPYELIGFLAAGGMGEVWRARDTRLGREVAIKVLPAEMASDPDRRARLEREARAASALNHPNIVTVHELGEADGVVYLVLERVDGRSLRELSAAGPLAPESLISVAAQVADGLAKAHGAGIVHRDLKPENVMLNDDGAVKILDFGLARMASGTDPQASTVPTESQLTQPGTLLGTLGYMSPEQASGQKVDHRSDQFSLGAMLYELATGRRAFARATPRETLAAVLRESPEAISRVNPAVPGELQRIVERCLAKDPDGRYASTKDLARDLRDLKERPLASRSPAPAVPGRSGVTWRWLAGGAALAVISALVSLDVGGLRRRLLPHASPRIESVAVLPLANLSRDPEQDYFADGITEALITELARIRSLRVTSRTSVMHFKGTTRTLPQIARELGVDAVVEGSVQRIGERVRISAQLIHAATDHHLWAESYERDLRELLALQSEVSRAIAREVAAQLTPDEQARLARPQRVAPEVYETYLRAAHFWNKGTEANRRTSLGLYERAIALDPAYAPAHLGVCRAYYGLGFTGWGALPPREAMPLAKAACLKALQLDETQPAAHAYLGSILAFFDWDRPAADAALNRSLALGPSDQSTLTSYGWFCSVTGRHAEALAQSRYAMELDPLSLPAIANHGWFLYWARRYDEAADQQRKILELEPAQPIANLMLGLDYLASSRHAQAIPQLERATELAGRTSVLVAQLAHAYGVAGRKAEARRMLDELVERSKRGYVASYWIALVHHGLGQDGEALAWLEKAFQDREALLFLDVEPRWDGLRSDPRFRDLQRRVGFSRPDAR